MFKQIGDFMENVFSTFFALIEKWKPATDEGKSF